MQSQILDKVLIYLGHSACRHVDAIREFEFFVILAWVRPGSCKMSWGGNIFSKTNQRTNLYKKGFLVSKTVNSAIRMNGGGGGWQLKGNGEEGCQKIMLVIKVFANNESSGHFNFQKKLQQGENKLPVCQLSLEFNSCLYSAYIFHLYYSKIQRLT